MDRVETAADRNVARAAALNTATLSDALDKLGIVGQCYRIKPLAPTFRLAGRAFTILYGPAANPPGTVGDYIDDVPEGSVIALDNGGRDDATVWGDILTDVAHRRGIAGTVIDGICRDVALALKLGYPLFSKDRWMRTGKDRVQVEATDIAITIGNARVSPGDILRGDADGVLVIPRAHETAVLDAAEAIEKAENTIRDAVRSGTRLDEARRLFRYHDLQSKRQQAAAPVVARQRMNVPSHMRGRVSSAREMCPSCVGKRPADGNLRQTLCIQYCIQYRPYGRTTPIIASGLHCRRMGGSSMRFKALALARLQGQCFATEASWETGGSLTAKKAASAFSGEATGDASGVA